MFEVHITVNTLEDKAIPAFESFCESIHAKPIIIELEEGKNRQQPMMSKVYKDISNEEFQQEINLLVDTFKAANYSVTRVKVEVPLKYIDEGEACFPDYKGRYYEWHGKVTYTDLQELKHLASINQAHLSNNSLKGEHNTRFLTVRTYGTKKAFKNTVKRLKQNLKSYKYNFIKEEYEYCAYDSNKSLDKGWCDTPEITDMQYLHLLAYEGFLRRASLHNNDFILKGSLLTRQYFLNKESREVGDLDFIYKYPINDKQEAASIFTDWVTKITETQLDDGIQFVSFKENEFWRDLDYAMADDFPTTNTDLCCTVLGQKLDVISLDLTWNLPLGEAPTEIFYKPVNGDGFILENTIPLSLQISWKLHQCIVRPRTKDLLDIILLIEHNPLHEEVVKKIAKHYKKECRKDGIHFKRLFHYLNGEVSNLYGLMEAEIQESWRMFHPFRTGFGFDFLNGFDLKDLNLFRVEEVTYESMQDLIYAFECKLREIGLEQALKD